MQHISLYYSI